MGELSKATSQNQGDALPLGSPPALSVLYARHWAELCGFVKRRFGSGPPDPQDIVQQTFLRFASLSTMVDVRNARAYLYRIAHNVFIEEHRRAVVGRAATAEMAFRQASSVEELTPERVLMADERMEIMRTVIFEQPYTRRRSFLLNRLDGLSCAEIARKTGYSESAIKKHILLVMTDLEAAMARRESAEPHAHRLDNPDECDTCTE